MRISQSASAENKVFTLDTLKGVDVTSSPLKVKSSRASYMRNMISKGGVNHKRNGWREIISFRDEDGKTLPVNGIFKYNDNVLVHAGCKFFKCTEKFDGAEEIKIKEGTTVNNTKSQAFFNSQKLWIVGAGDYLVYNGEEIQSVKNSDDVYIPTTAIGITDTLNGNLIENYEAPSLFTSKRINRLLGKNIEGMESFYLDGKANLSNVVRIKAEVELGGITSSDRVAPAWCYEKKTCEVTSGNIVVSPAQTDLMNVFSGTGIIQTYDAEEIKYRLHWPLLVEKLEVTPLSGCKIPLIKLELVDGSEIYIDKYVSMAEQQPITDSIGKAIKSISFISKQSTTATDVDSSLKVAKVNLSGYKLEIGLCTLEYELKATRDDVTFTPLVEPTIRNENGEEVLFFEYDVRAQLSVPKAHKKACITFMRALPAPIEGESNIEVTYTADYEKEDVLLSNATELALSAGANILIATNGANKMLYTDVDREYSYFPDINYIYVGEENQDITALTIAYDSCYAFKQENGYRLKFSTLEKSDREIVIKPSIEAIYGDGCENQYTTCVVNDDAVFFNRKGVFGISSSSDTRVGSLRSSNIEKAITSYSKEQRKQAFACEHEGRYYLFVAGDVYIADSRYKTYESNRLDTSFEYEWWLWDNCPARCAVSLDDKLYLGKGNGSVAVFTDEFFDVEKIDIADGQMVCYGSYLVFDKALGVKDGEKVEISGACELLAQDIRLEELGDSLYSCQLSLEWMLSNDNELRFYEGDRILAENEGALYPFVIEEVDIERCRLVLRGYVRVVINTDLSYRLLKECIASSYTVSHLGEELVLVNDNGENAQFVRYENIKGTILREKNVECELVTAVFSMGGEQNTKTLHKIMFTPSSDTTGEVEFGYETNRTIKNEKKVIGEGFSFENLNFTTFAFDGHFYKNYVKRVLERNFNYIVFKFASSDRRDFAIEKFSCIYSTNNVLRGDR